MGLENEEDEKEISDKPPRAYDIVKSNLMDGARIKGKPPRACTLKKTCSLIEASPQGLAPYKGSQ